MIDPCGLWEIVTFEGPTTEDYENLRVEAHTLLFCADYEPDDRDKTELEELIIAWHNSNREAFPVGSPADILQSAAVRIAKRGTK